MQGVWILSLSLAAVCAIAVDYSRQGSWIKSSRFARGAIIFLGIGLAAALRKATVIPQLFLVLVVERRWPRQRDDLLSTEKVRCGMWDMLKKSEDFLL